TIGVFAMTRDVVNPFTEKQIELIATFADQAVIAIENARLLNELRQRTDDLSESLEQQTATSEVLKIISSSPGDLEPVFQSVLANAISICGADRGLIYRQEREVYGIVASHGHSAKFLQIVKQIPIHRDRSSATGRAILDRRVVHIQDILADPEYKWADD